MFHGVCIILVLYNNSTPLLTPSPAQSPAASYRNARSRVTQAASAAVVPEAAVARAALVAGRPIEAGSARASVSLHGSPACLLPVRGWRYLRVRDELGTRKMATTTTWIQVRLRSERRQLKMPAAAIRTAAIEDEHIRRGRRC